MFAFTRNQQFKSLDLSTSSSKIIAAAARDCLRLWRHASANSSASLSQKLHAWTIGLSESFNVKTV